MIKWLESKIVWLRDNLFYLAFAAALLMTACGMRAPGETETPVDPAPIPSPEPIPTPLCSRYAVCNEYTAGGSWAFENPAMPYPSESIKTKKDWSTGRITFSITGLDSALMGSGQGTDFFILMAMLKGADGGEKNFHYINSDGTGRLVDQGFTPGGRLLYDIQHIRQGMWWIPTEIYSFDFRWDSKLVTVMVKDSGGNIIHDGYVRAEGAFTGATYIHVGNGALSQYEGINTTIYIINPVLE